MAGLIHLGLEALNLGGFGCLLRDFAGIPCPGCGLTTALRHAWLGEWRASISDHLFLPVFLSAFLLVVLASVLPDEMRQRVIRGVAAGEERTGAVALVACALVVYWLARLAAP